MSSLKTIRHCSSAPARKQARKFHVTKVSCSNENLIFISGAFAIFVSSGVSFRKALCLLSTCYLFSYVGVVVGAILGTSLNLTVWIFAVIAGMFLYIALAEMVSGTYSCFKYQTLSLSQEDVSGGSRSPAPSLFLDQTEAQRAEKFFCRPPPPRPLSEGLGPPPGCSLSYQELGNDDGDGNENFQTPICLHYTG